MSNIEDERRALLQELRRKAVEEKNIQSGNRKLRQTLKDKQNEYERTEDALKALQTAGQMIGEVLKQLTEDKFIVKASSGPRYVVGCRKAITNKLKTGDRVSLDYTTLTIMRKLPREVDPMVFKMLDEAPGDVSYKNIGGLSDQIREIRESIELPLTNPQLFARVGIKPPKGVLLYGPPGTGKTLLARAVAHHTDCCFIRVSGSELVQKYIGEGARMVRELFVLAREHAPSIIFMDEVDSIGGARIEGRRGGDSEVQRTMLELLNQLDGFEPAQNIKILMATNRIDILDDALLRPGRIDRKIEFPNPNENSRLQILKIHSRKMNLRRGINFKKIASKLHGASGAECKAVCTEAGMFALRERRIHITQEDFEMSVVKVMKKDADADMSKKQLWK
mmetsp:Transcript_49435/g.60688  ORF Transcript_49435/g.60688 Transcript_49435/m.60688 type:complete len:393 (-) Transcript_49435:387-1565(-)